MISPYPEDADKEAAGEIGYFTDSKAFMIRIYHFDTESRVLTTSQIQLESSNLDLINQFITNIKQDHRLATSPTQILATDIYLQSDSVTTIDLAKMYDDLLEENNPGRHYFLGARVNNKSTNVYRNLYNKTHTVENDTQKLVDELVGTNIELAKSLNAGFPTREIQELLNQAMEAKNRYGEYQIEFSKRNALLRAMNHFNREAAIILKDFMLRRTYAEIKCIAEEDEAKQIFGKTYASAVKNNYYNDIPEEIRYQQIYDMSSSVQVVFRFCGGSITFGNHTGQINIFTMSWGEFRNFMTGGFEETFDCPRCPEKIVAGKGITTCPRCGLTKEQAGSKCD